MDAADWDARYAAHHAERGLVWTAEPNGFLVAEVGGETPGRALDLGCGEGRNAVWLAEQGWRVTAVDFSPVALSAGRRLAAERQVEVEWVEADLTRYHPEEGVFDLVAIFYVHLDAARRAELMRRAVVAVAPGGLVLVVGHDLDNLEGGVGGPPDPEVLYTVAATVAELDGLIVERAEQVQRPVARDDLSGTAIDALVRARRPW